MRNNRRTTRTKRNHARTHTHTHDAHDAHDAHRIPKYLMTSGYLLPGHDLEATIGKAWWWTMFWICAGAGQAWQYSQTLADPMNIFVDYILFSWLVATFYYGRASPCVLSHMQQRVRVRGGGADRLGRHATRTPAGAHHTHARCTAEWGQSILIEVVKINLGKPSKLGKRAGFAAASSGSTGKVAPQQPDGGAKLERSSFKG